MGNVRHAFTLAEVLITLAIIGIVAAMTIPTVIAKYQQQVMLSQLKKMYSTLSATTQRATIDNGPISDWGSIAKIGGVQWVNTYLIPYLNVSNTCQTAAGAMIFSGACKLDRYTTNGLSDPWQAGALRFFLNDGSSVLVYSPNNGRSVHIVVDLNGNKKPNVFGKDVFWMVYEMSANKPSLEPYGYYKGKPFDDYLKGDVSLYGCNKNEHGLYCFAAIYANNWQIPAGYPW